MFNKLILGVGNIFIMMKSIQMQLPKEIDDLILKQKMFWVIFTWFYINNIINNNSVTLLICVMFSLYLYKDEIEEIAESEDFAKLVSQVDSRKLADSLKINEMLKKKNGN